MQTAFYKKPNICHMAIHLLLKANHTPQSFVWNGKSEIINTGQILTGRKALSDETGQSQQQVRTSLLTLSNPTIGFLTIKTTNKFSIISIGKYGEYQELSTNKLTNKQPTTNQQLTTNNNDKNVKNEKNITTPAGPVDWGNCKTPQQRLAAHYLKRFCPDIYNGTQIQATAFFKRHGRALSDICNQCGGDIPLILKAFDLTVEYFNSKNLTWIPDTAAKHISDYIGKAKQKLNQGEQIYAEPEF